MNILGKNKPVTEPSFFALLVKTINVKFLHLGVYNSVDAAFSAAVEQMKDLPFYNTADAVEIELWNSVPLSEVSNNAPKPEAKKSKKFKNPDVVSSIDG
jgi:hypothetical protein